MRSSLITTVILLAGGVLFSASAEPLAGPASLAFSSAEMAACAGDRPKISIRLDRDRAARKRYCPRKITHGSCPTDPLVTLAWSDPAYSSRLLAIAAAQD